MFSVFKSRPLMDEDSTQWMFDVFAWALQNFDADLFYSHTVLVQPSNRFFPGRADNEQAMAQLIFDRVAYYAGTAHWPAQVNDQNACAIDTAPVLQLSGPLRGVELAPDHGEMSQPLQFPYNAQQVSNPEAMIATFAHTVAHYLGQMAQTAPPGGAEYWPHVTEVLATYLGFGLMFANSAYNFRGGCGSCYNPNAQRNAYLTEQQATYALALFAVLKGLPNSDVTPHMKSHLRSFYRKAVKEINNRADDLAMMPLNRLQA
jgi:hypothetical protein